MYKARLHSLDQSLVAGTMVGLTFGKIPESMTLGCSETTALHVNFSILVSNLVRFSVNQPSA